ncbi:uncharacterized protein G2W53_040016 [Senna tora]|uniref:Uncharacterized protein n=1 Tax=Senna tora TaxID=362788 RepID=A0A834SS14_9FABA|nr:uncharacterized protein G2W53_040016 [Senna tora]
MTHACPLVMRVVPWREALGRGTSRAGNHRWPPPAAVDRRRVSAIFKNAAADITRPSPT